MEQEGYDIQGAALEAAVSGFDTSNCLNLETGTLGAMFKEVANPGPANTIQMNFTPQP